MDADLCRKTCSYSPLVYILVFFVCFEYLCVFGCKYEKQNYIVLGQRSQNCVSQNYRVSCKTCFMFVKMSEFWIKLHLRKLTVFIWEAPDLWASTWRKKKWTAQPSFFFSGLQEMTFLSQIKYLKKQIAQFFQVLDCCCCFGGRIVRTYMWIPWWFTMEIYIILLNIQHFTDWSFALSITGSIFLSFTFRLLIQILRKGCSTKWV